MTIKEGVCKRIILSIFFLLVLCRTAGAQDSQKATLTAADAGTCSATSTACLVINVPSGSGGATFNIGANASANTVQFEATADYGTTWVALNVVPSNGTTAVTSTTSTGIWQANVAGYTKLRMRCSTFVGGTTTTYINLSTASARSNGGGGGTSAFGPNYSVGGGTAQAQTVAPTTAVTDATLVDGYQICWSANAANTGAAPTLAGSGTSTFSAHPIVRGNSATLLAGDIAQLLPYACAIYNAANTQFVLQNPQGNLGCLTGTAGAWCATEGSAPTNVSGLAATYPDSTQHELFAATNGTNSYGMLTRVQPGLVHKIAQTGAITTATLCAAVAGACNIAGNYTVEWAFAQTGVPCTTNTTGGVTFLVTWTDQNGTAHTAQSLAMDDSLSLIATTGTFHFNQTGNGLGTVWASGNFNLSSNGSIIQYATGFAQCSVAGTATYQLDAWVVRKQ